MKRAEIHVGRLYLAKMNGKLATVRVDAIRRLTGGPAYGGTSRAETRYDVTNTRTGRTTSFRSAAKFRKEVFPQVTSEDT